MDTLLPTQMFPRLPARATFIADTNFVSGRQKMFLILFRSILCSQQMFPSMGSPRNIMGNNVSSTMCPRLPGPVHNEQKCILHACDGSIIISARCVPVDRNAVLTRPFFHFPRGLSQ